MLKLLQVGMQNMSSSTNREEGSTDRDKDL